MLSGATSYWGTHTGGSGASRILRMPSKKLQVALTHLGGPTVVVDYAGLRIVSDPAFDPAGSKYKVSGLLPVSKTTETAIAADALGDVHAVLVSHDTHADNFDKAGRALAKSLIADGAGKVVTNPSAAKHLPGSVGLATWETTTLDAPGGVTVTVTAAPARHAHGPVALITGPVTGFVLQAPGHPTLYVSGDNVSSKATRQVAERFSVNVAIMHAGNPRFGATGPIPFCMTAIQVARAVATLGLPKTLVVHSDGWSHFKESEPDIARAFAQPPVAATRIVAPLGETVSV